MGGVEIFLSGMAAGAFLGCTDSDRDRTGNGKKKIMRKRKSALCMGSP